MLWRFQISSKPIRINQYLLICPKTAIKPYRLVQSICTFYYFFHWYLMVQFSILPGIVVLYWSTGSQNLYQSSIQNLDARKAWESLQRVVGWSCITGHKMEQTYHSKFSSVPGIIDNRWNIPTGWIRDYICRGLVNTFPICYMLLLQKGYRRAKRWHCEATTDEA